jgi:ubiquinone/menaquinone biosynthesis C-methylase UbiE
MSDLEELNIEKYTSQNPLLRWAIKKFYSDLYSLIVNLRVKKMLDVGCGEGFVTNFVKNANKSIRIDGLDVDRKKIMYAKKRFSQINFKVGSVYSIPKPDSSYDLVVATEVLEHLSDPPRAIKEMKRVSSKYLLFSVPRQPHFRIASILRLRYLERWGEHPEHLHSWTRNELESFLSKFVKVRKIKNSTFWVLALCEK